MRSMVALNLVAMAVLTMGCGTELTASTDSGDEASLAGVATTAVTGPADDRAPAADDSAPAADDSAPAADDGAPVDAAAGDVDDGTTAGAPGSAPPPAAQEQSCQSWQDCGPHFGDLNSGFDCEVGQCACNVAGTYDDECASIGGLWSDEECFCFVTQSRPPEPANDASAADDEPYCWWRWYEECQPDEWVDTSYYRRVCDDTGCYDRYVQRGYWESGACDDVWVKRCDDGTRREYR
jgi:hypothetical protein